MPKCFSQSTQTGAGDSPRRSPSVSDRKFWVAAYVRFDCKLQSFGKSSNRTTATLKCKEITKFEINFVMFNCQTKSFLSYTQLELR